MFWGLLLGMTAITFYNRYAFFARSLRYQPGEKARRFLSFSSYAILTSIWTPILFGYSPSSGLSVTGLDYLLAASAAALMTLFGVRSIFVVLISTAMFFVLRGTLPA
ncbi:MAG: AzlD domain-containing protein [Pseudomonadota bacterium]